jgi:histidine triad (HIT) family protein
MTPDDVKARAVEEARACVFCEIVNGRAPARFRYTWPETVAFEPLNPVTPGHLLIVPRRHVEDFAEDGETTASVMRRATEAAADMGPANLITSRGPEATQSVFHMHVHLVPRSEGDGLALPWTDPDALGRAKAEALREAAREIADLIVGLPGYDGCDCSTCRAVVAVRNPYRDTVEPVEAPRSDEPGEVGTGGPPGRDSAPGSPQPPRWDARAERKAGT